MHSGNVLCNILRSSGSLDNAIIIAENLLERNPDSVDILLIHLLCLIDLKHPVEVIQYIESSVEYLDTRVDYFKAVLLILSSKVIPGLSIVKSTLEAEYVFMYPNQHSRGHVFSRTRPYSAVFTVFFSVVFTRCSEDAAQYRTPAPIFNT